MLCSQTLYALLVPSVLCLLPDLQALPKAPIGTSVRSQTVHDVRHLTLWSWPLGYHVSTLVYT